MFSSFKLSKFFSPGLGWCHLCGESDMYQSANTKALLNAYRSYPGLFGLFGMNKTKHQGINSTRRI